MRTTPPLPVPVREFRDDSSNYRNAHQLCKSDRLYGTEERSEADWDTVVLDDWDSEILLLAKDFVPACYLERRISSGHRAPYSRFDNFRTNKMLVTRAFRGLGWMNRTFLYGSICANLLRNDGKRSGTLPDMSHEVHEYLRWTLRDFVLANMSNLRAVVCMGEDAWDLASDFLELRPVAFRSQREAKKPLTSIGTSWFAIPHPSRWRHQHIEYWHAVRAHTG